MLKKNPTYQSTSRCAEPKSAPNLPRRPPNLFLAESENFLQHFPQETLSELEKNGNAIFHSRPRVIVELTRKTVKIRLTRDQKVIFDYWFEKIHLFDLETHAFG